MNKLIKTIPRDSVQHEFVKSLNGILKLTDREIGLLSVMLKYQAIDKDLQSSRRGIDTAANRKLFMAEANLTRDRIAKYIKSFRKKGVLVRKPNGAYIINQALIPEIIGGKTVQIVLILKLNDNDN